jgi:hypothetical protein
MVGKVGLEPTIQKETVFETVAYTIPPLVRMFIYKSSEPDRQMLLRDPELYI